MPVCVYIAYITSRRVYDVGGRCRHHPCAVRKLLKMARVNMNARMRVKVYLYACVYACLCSRVSVLPVHARVYVCKRVPCRTCA